MIAPSPNQCRAGPLSWLVWAVLILGIASPGWAGQRARGDEPPEWSDRRDIHGELPADANLLEALYARVEPQADSAAGELEPPCPCRTIATEEDAGEAPPPHPMGLIGLGFGSAVLAFLMALVAWQTHATRGPVRS